MEHLDIPGVAAEMSANTFFRQNKVTTTRLVVIFPGAGYSARMPLLYYHVRLALDQGADVLTVDYDYSSAAAREHPDFRNRLMTHITSTSEVALKQRRYDHVTLIGKSLGTRAMSWMLSDEHHPFSKLQNFKTIWLTPLWTDESVFAIMRKWKGPALHIIGDADPYYAKECEDQLTSQRTIKVLVITNANHSLEIDGDITASLAAINSAVLAARDFAFKKD